MRILPLVMISMAAALAACSVEPVSFTPHACGDGVQAIAEQCDDGNATDDDGCDTNCTPTACGNGVQTLGEACDDGNVTDGDGCDRDCTPTICGNGIQTAGEQCDDGNTMPEKCAYGLVSCVVCDARCQFVPGEISFCGDGLKQSSGLEGLEACDDGNATCGTCSSDCRTHLGSIAAMGEIHVVAPGLLDKETFKIGDGFHTTKVTFQYSLTGTTTDSSYVLIDLRNVQNTGNAVAPPTRDAINSVGDELLVTAIGVSGTTVFLKHDRPGPKGNVDMEEYVSAGSFRAEGLIGGAGSDCDSGQACRSDGDCLSNLCALNVCQ